jgi:FkbM family methyltransferase
VEADPTVFEYLQKNVIRAKCSNIKLLNKAVWYEDGSISFSSDHADGGGIASCLSREIKGDRSVVDVEAVTLSALVDESPVDLLKIDVEGAEVDLLINQSECLQYVERLFVEYHSYAGKPQRLNELLGVLQEAGFRFCIQSEYAPKQPFKDLKVDCGMDNRLNIFAWK